MSSAKQTIAGLTGSALEGRYRIDAPIAEGSMGTVFRATKLAGNIPVAIKVLHDELSSDPAQRARFEREARALFGLEHPNLVHVFDSGVVDKVPYLVMEFLDGITLSDYVGEYGISPDHAIELTRQALRGLAHAHSAGVVHRDLKTENLVLLKDPAGRMTVKLLDFGLARFIDDERWGTGPKLTLQGSVFGTPAYMAPEQCTGGIASPASDVYSMGIILFELLTGTWPFVEESRLAMCQAHLTRKPPSIASCTDQWDFVPELDGVVQKALAKNPLDRYQTAGEMLIALDSVPRPPARTRKANLTSATEAKSSALWIGIGAACALLLAGILAWWFLR